MSKKDENSEYVLFKIPKEFDDKYIEKLLNIYNGD